MTRPRTLFGGLYLSYKFFKEIVKRTTGVPAEAPLLVTLFAVGVVGNALRRLVAPAFGPFRPQPPSIPGASAGFAIPLAIVRRGTGVPARDAPLVTGVMALGTVLPTIHVLVAIVRAVPATLRAIVRFAIGRP
jgi:hypothetical protein